MNILPRRCLRSSRARIVRKHLLSSPNQVLTHTARAAAKQLNKWPFQPLSGRARRAQMALVRATWLGEIFVYRSSETIERSITSSRRAGRVSGHIVTAIVKPELQNSELGGSRCARLGGTLLLCGQGDRPNFEPRPRARRDIRI